MYTYDLKKYSYFLQFAFSVCYNVYREKGGVYPFLDSGSKKARASPSLDRFDLSKEKTFICFCVAKMRKISFMVYLFLN